MAQKTLNAFVVIGGRVDNSFGQIGTALINMGSTVDEISSKLINFGKESVQVYRKYEDSMLEAEGALATTYGKGTQRLRTVMDQLDQAASQWAASTIFHTDDVANAINEAAHANWDLDKILDGIPATMRLAQAGGMDLSQALDYVITSTQAAGIGFDDLGEFIDVWSFAANSSAGTIQEFGDAMQRMGNTMTFTDSKEELVTLLAVLHNTGTKGAAAGTLLRNSMIRLIAPTKKASDVMATLGVSEGDIGEAMSEVNGDIDAATASLEQAGFSAYDAQGNLKGFIDIYTDLDKALKGMSEEERNNVLSSIFPTRTITGAMAFLDAAASGFDGLYAALKAGDAAGYSEYLSDLMMSGLTGSIETFNSKVEELKRSVGEELAPDIENMTGFLGGLIDKVSGMDEAKFGALVDGLKTIAGSGAALIGAGSFMRFLGMVFTLPGAIALVTIGAASMTSALNSLKQAELEGMFGDMSVDMGTLNDYIKTLGDDFNTAFEDVNNFAAALDTAVANYKTASSEFSSDLLTAVLTKNELSPDDKAKLEQLGIDIYSEVLGAINASSDMASEFWKVLYGGDGTAEFDPKYQQIQERLMEGNQSAIAQAGDIAERLKAAMMKGFEEGFSDEDYNTILGMFEEYNALIAQAQNEALTEEQFIQQEKWLHKAQTASLSDIQELAKTVTEQRDTQLAELEDRYLTERARLKYYGATEEELADVDAKYEDWRNRSGANYDQFLMTLWGTQTTQSGLGGSYANLGNYADMYLSGAMSADAVMGLIKAEMGPSKYAGDNDFRNPLAGDTTREQLGKIMGYMISSMGGEQEVANRIAYYDKLGETETANQMRRILAMEQLVNGFQTIVQTERAPLDFLNITGDFATTGQGVDAADYYLSKQETEGNRARMDELSGVTQEPSTLDQAKTTVAALGEAVTNYLNTVSAGGTAMEIESAWSEMSEGQRRAYSELATKLGEKYDLEKVASGDSALHAQEGSGYQYDYAIWKLLNTPSADAFKYLANPPQIQTPTATEGVSATSGYTIEGGAAAATAAHDEAQSTLDSLGDVTNGSAVTGGTAAASAAWSEMQSFANSHSIQFRTSVTGGVGGAGVVKVAAKAKGGRETQPSLFAEAGIPEWYIPEEHTDNTADLILAAAYGSGFDIVDLAERAGANLFAEGGTDGGSPVSLNWSTISDSASGGSGSDSSGGGSSITVQYSPVIHADNAAGIEDALLEDKKRMEQWMEEWWAKKQLYESMVAYR